MKRILTTALGLLLALAVMMAMTLIFSVANAEWPEKDIHVLVGFSAGGTSDMGTRLLFEAAKKELGVNIIFDDIDSFRSNESEKLWAFFAEKDMPYHIDSDTDNIPSLAEMTEIALKCLAGKPVV